MNSTKPFIITISRQFGSGGEYIGLLLSRKLDMFYADKEIINLAARQFAILEKEVEQREEKTVSFWKALFDNDLSPSGFNISPMMMNPTDRELYDAEAGIIKQIAEQRSSVIIGRSGFDILHDHPNHISLFIYADMNYRIDQVCKLYEVSKEAAVEMIVKSDKERTAYFKTFTGKDWNDQRNYHLSIKSSKMEVNKTVDTIVRYATLAG